MTSTKAKRIRKALDLFEWHVTHTEDCVCVLLCYGRGHSCLQRSLKQLNNLTGIRLTVDRVFAVQDAAFAESKSWTTSTRFAVNWAIGQYKAAVANG
jgi:hypothetical protein